MRIVGWAILSHLAGGGVAAAGEPAYDGDITFTFSKQSEMDRRTPARLDLPAGQRLVLRVWLTASVTVSIADAMDGFVTASLRDRSGRTLLHQPLGKVHTLRPYSLPKGGARNFLVVPNPPLFSDGAGSYTLELRYTSPAIGKARAVNLGARTELVIQPAPVMQRRYLRAEVMDVGVSENNERATAQIIIHNEGCDPVEFSTLPPGRLEVFVRNAAGHVLCRPDRALDVGRPTKVETLGPGDSVGLGVAFARCDAAAVRAASPIEGLRGQVRYDSTGLPGWPFAVDTAAKVVRWLQPR